MKACAVSPENEETVDLELRVDEIVSNDVYFYRVSPFFGRTLILSLDFKVLRHGCVDSRGHIIMTIRITKELAIYKGLLVRDPCKEIETGKIETKKILDHIILDLVFESEIRSSIGRLVFADPYSTPGIISVLKTDLQILDRYMTTEVIKDQPTLSNIKMMKIKMTRSKAIECGLHKDPEVTKLNYTIADSGNGMGNMDLGKSERRFAMASDSKENSGYKTIRGGHTLPRTSFQNAIKEWVKGNAVTGGMSDEKYASYRDALKPKSREKVNRLRAEFRNFMSGNEK